MNMTCICARREMSELTSGSSVSVIHGSMLQLLRVLEIIVAGWCRYQLLRPARAYSELFAPLRAQAQATGAAESLIAVSGLDSKAAAQQAVQALQPPPAKPAVKELVALVEKHLALLAQVCT